MIEITCFRAVGNLAAWLPGADIQIERHMGLVSNPKPYTIGLNYLTPQCDAAYWWSPAQLADRLNGHSYEF
jgi:hypothetical protein